jgi:hypothetical protein
MENTILADREKMGKLAVEEVVGKLELLVVGQFDFWEHG